MDRLTALDTEFLLLEDGVSHMHIGGLSVFEGDPPTEAQLRSLLASKLHLLPRYRQRVHPVPLDLGRPVWVDDPHFSLGYHVRSTALPDPSDEALCRLMGRVMSHELDRERPLWECWIVHGLPDRRWGLISKVHHCMVDGLAGVGLLTALLDPVPACEPPAPEPWHPVPAPSEAALVADAWAGLASDLWHRAGRLPDDLRHPWRTVERAGATALGLVRFTQNLVATPETPIDGVIGAHRRWAHTTVTLDDVRTIRRRHGGTVNDVVVAVVTKGYRDLLLEQGEDPTQTTLRTLVPVSVRVDDGDGDAALGNRVSALLYDLPLAIDDPVDRLVAVSTQLSERKRSHLAEAGAAVTAFADLVPPMLTRDVSRLLLHVAHDRSQRSINTVITNVPGPQLPLFCLGRPLVEQRPYVPISHGLRYGTAILSYNGLLCFGITGDYDRAPGVDTLAGGIAAGVDELLEVSR